MYIVCMNEQMVDHRVEVARKNGQRDQERMEHTPEETSDLSILQPN